MIVGSSHMSDLAPHMSGLASMGPAGVLGGMMAGMVSWLAQISIFFHQKKIPKINLFENIFGHISVLLVEFRTKWPRPLWRLKFEWEGHVSELSSWLDVCIGGCTLQKESAEREGSRQRCLSWILPNRWPITFLSANGSTNLMTRPWSIFQVIFPLIVSLKCHQLVNRSTWLPSTWIFPMNLNKWRR